MDRGEIGVTHPQAKDYQHHQELEKGEALEEVWPQDTLILGF